MSWPLALPGKGDWAGHDCAAKASTDSTWRPSPPSTPPPRPSLPSPPPPPPTHPPPRSKHARPAPTGPLVIPALPNKDWRRAAEDLRAARPGGGARKKQLYLPESGSGGMSMTSRVEGAAATSSSQAVAEAVADQVNAEPVVGGLEQPVRRARDAQNGADGGAGPLEAAPPPPPSPPTAPVQAAAPALTDEQRALRELLGGADGGEQEQQELAAIYSGPDARTGPADEGDAFKQDVSSRPDEVRSLSL